MMLHFKDLLEKGWVMIDKRFTKCIDALRTVSDFEGHVDKQNMSHSDIWDSLIMCATAYGYNG